MADSDTSARRHGKNAAGTIPRSGAIRRLTNDDFRIGIFYREDNLDNKEYGANVGAVILLIVNVIALATLFLHVASR